MTLSLPICAYMISKKIDGCVFVSTEDYLQLQHLKRKKKREMQYVGFVLAQQWERRSNTLPEHLYKPISAHWYTGGVKKFEKSFKLSGGFLFYNKELKTKVLVNTFAS